MEHQLKKNRKSLIRNLFRFCFKNSKNRKSVKKPHKSHNSNYKSEKTKKVFTQSLSQSRNKNKYNRLNAKLVKVKIRDVKIFGEDKTVDVNNAITLPDNNVIELSITIDPPST